LSRANWCDAGVVEVLVVGRQRVTVGAKQSHLVRLLSFSVTCDVVDMQWNSSAGRVDLGPLAFLALLSAKEHECLPHSVIGLPVLSRP